MQTPQTASPPLRLPNRREVGLLFAACAFPLHTWALLMFFHQLPAYLLQMSLGSALAVLAYALALALIESLLALGTLVLAAMALPRRVFQERRVALVALGFLMTFLWVIPVHFQTTILNRLSWNMIAYQALVMGWLLSYLSALIFFSHRLLRRGEFHQRVIAFFDRLSLLALIYLPIDVICLLVVIWRNLS